MADCHQHRCPPLHERRDLISGAGWSPPASTCRFTFLRRRNIYVSEICLLRALGLECIRWLGTSILETVPCPVSVLSQGPGASPPPCDACPYAGCISLEKLWRITPTGMAICPLTDIAWALQAHQDRILKHLVHYITALWWMDFTRACPLGRTNYV